MNKISDFDESKAVLRPTPVPLTKDTLTLTEKFKDMATKLCKENHFEDKKTHDIIFNSIKKQYYSVSEAEKEAIRADLEKWGI